MSRRWICTKFGLGGPLADVINCAEFCCSRLRGFDSVGVKVSHLPLNCPVAVNTELASQPVMPMLCRCKMSVCVCLSINQSISLLTSLRPGGRIAVKYSSCNKGQKQQ